MCRIIVTNRYDVADLILLPHDAKEATLFPRPGWGKVAPMGQLARIDGKDHWTTVRPRWFV